MAKGLVSVLNRRRNNMWDEDKHCTCHIKDDISYLKYGCIGALIGLFFGLLVYLFI